MANENMKTKVLYGTHEERQAIINKMTNWQRNQAGRKCGGNWDSLTLDQLNEFSVLPRRKAG